MLFPYEEFVKFFQCDGFGISPRGLVNCGNRYGFMKFLFWFSLTCFSMDTGKALNRKSNQM